MKKNLFSLLLMLGFIFVISSMILSCSDGDEPSVEPDVPVNQVLHSVQIGRAHV